MMSFLAVSGCAKNDSSYKNGPDAAYYSDWDRAVRYDVDMQNLWIVQSKFISKNEGGIDNGDIHKFIHRVLISFYLLF